MRRKKTSGAALAVVSLMAFLLASGETLGQASPYRGLWVGEVTLNAVNEVAVPLDESNIPIAPDPKVPTLTFDHANLRLLLHVNGAGQVALLKDVAILDRSADDENMEGPGVETDLALVTDPRVYADYPPQSAVRYASAAFDFGDAKATEALDAIVRQAAAEARDFVKAPGLPVATQGERVTARNNAIAAMTPALVAIADSADVAAAFDSFLNDFNSGVLDTIAADPSAPEVGQFEMDAETLRDQSFYGDCRALDMVHAVVGAVTSAPPDVAERETAAHNMASSFADLENRYQRFISGKVFGDMILAAADEAPAAAKAPGATVASVESVMRGIPESTEAITAALQSKVQRYTDTRAEDALDAVIQAMAASALANAAEDDTLIAQQAEAAGRAELANRVARYPLPFLAPTLDYNEFVQSAAYAAAVDDAAYAAADAAIAERVANPLYTEESLYGAALVATINELQTLFSTAARAMRTELPLEGAFGPGEGDPRFVRDLNAPSDLGAAGLTGRIYLPANYPTNPFRHRRHPDHTTGFNIERIVRLDFDGVEGGALESAGYGVDSIAGTYREEIFGLHKPLGPDPDNVPIGLKTEGRFELRRISRIDTLNTR